MSAYSLKCFFVFLFFCFFNYTIAYGMIVFYLEISTGTPADLYLIDEPSAYLDSEQRVIAAKVHTHTHVCRIYTFLSFFVKKTIMLME